MLNYALIVDPFSSGNLYADELIKRNIAPLAVLSHYPIVAVYEASFKKNDFQYVFVFQNNLDKLIDEINFVTGNSEIKFCLPGAESGVGLADSLAGVFCPDKINLLSLTQARMNKYWMSKQLSRVGLALPLTHRVDSADEALDWAEKNNLIDSGVVIKPLDSAGTDGVSLCFNKNDIYQNVQAILGEKNKLNKINEHVLVQEFLTGEEYVVDTINYHGMHAVTNICKYTKTTRNGSCFVYDCLDFLPEDDDNKQILTDYCFEVLDGLGIQNGPAHAEIMLTKSGPKLIEVGSRLHGGVGIPAARLATGTSQLDLTLDLFLNDTITPENLSFHLKNYVKIVFLISDLTGVIAKQSEKILAIESLASFVLMKADFRKGKWINTTTDLFTSPGLIVLSHSEIEQIEKDYQTIRALEKEGLVILENS